ncbi:MAG: CDP-alcohol phosphatidyltransferase family protein [Clostridiales bacterium]|nr:CDP-alcohol phosphatidyltransferase family protein [Clostridiales bacterium]
MFIGHYNKANLLTLLGLLFSLSGGFFALQKNWRLAVILLICAGVCDLFDGVIARRLTRTAEEKAFGVQFDTVVDVVSFCVVPAVIVHAQTGAAWVCAVYIACGLIRLAYFNTIAEARGPVAHYQGVPVTYISLVLPIMLLFHHDIVTISTLAVMAVLYIANIKIPKPRGVWYIVFPLMAVVFAAVWWFV